jgi:hypothetical protein
VTETGNRATRDRPSAADALLYDPIDIAASKLGITEEALRARCRRARRGTGAATVADLGAGIRAVKFGRTWRVRFPKDDRE